MGPVAAADLDRAVQSSPLHERYAQAVDRGSAYEKLTAAERAAKGPEEAAAPARTERERAPRDKAGKAEEKHSVVQQVVGSSMFKSLARSVGSQVGREITRSLFGTARRRR
jgi:hypothetical protein